MEERSNSSDSLRGLLEDLVEAIKAIVTEGPNGEARDLVSRAEEYLHSHGCSLFEGSLPPELYLQTCVLDEDRPYDCVFATLLDRDGRGRESCKLWKGSRPSPPVKFNFY